MSYTSEDAEEVLRSSCARYLDAQSFREAIAKIKAEVLRESADTIATRSETFLDTMQRMAGDREYTHDDVVRYGAYSAEANTLAIRLRSRADKLDPS